MPFTIWICNVTLGFIKHFDLTVYTVVTGNSDGINTNLQGCNLSNTARI